MIFISLAKFRKKPTRESTAQLDQMWREFESWGVKRIGVYWTLGRYDAVAILEGPDEKTAMKAALKFSDMVATETLVAIKREDAIKLLE